MLVWSDPGGSHYPCVWGYVCGEDFLGPVPVKVVFEICGCHTMEVPKPLFQTSMVCVDVVDVQVRRLRARFSRGWQHMEPQPCTPRERGYCRAAITA